MKKLFILTLCLTTFTATQAYENVGSPSLDIIKNFHSRISQKGMKEKRKQSFKDGDVEGNGGDVVVCNKNGKKTFTLFDIHEAKQETNDFRIHNDGKWKLDLGKEELSVKDKVYYAFKKLKNIDLGRYLIYTKWAEDFLNEAKKEVKKINVDNFEGRLPDISDRGSAVIPDDCEVLQLIVQNTQVRETRYKLDDSLWRHMSKNQQAATIIHEIVYRDFLTQPNNPHKTSMQARYFNSLLTSKQIHNYTASEDKYNDLLKQINVDWKVKNGFPNRVEGTCDDTRMWTLLKIHGEYNRVCSTGKLDLYHIHEKYHLKCFEGHLLSNRPNGGLLLNLSAGEVFKTKNIKVSASAPIQFHLKYSGKNNPITIEQLPYSKANLTIYSRDINNKFSIQAKTDSLRINIIDSDKKTEVIQKDSGFESFHEYIRDKAESQLLKFKDSFEREYLFNTLVIDYSDKTFRFAKNYVFENIPYKELEIDDPFELKSIRGETITVPFKKGKEVAKPARIGKLTSPIADISIIRVLDIEESNIMFTLKVNWHEFYDQDSNGKIKDLTFGIPFKYLHKLQPKDYIVYVPFHKTGVPQYVLAKKSCPFFCSAYPEDFVVELGQDGNIIREIGQENNL